VDAEPSALSVAFQYGGGGGAGLLTTARTVPPTARPVRRAAAAPVFTVVLAALAVVLAADAPAPATARAAHAFRESATSGARNSLMSIVLVWRCIGYPPFDRCASDSMGFK
jgi:hypothetical protein